VDTSKLSSNDGRVSYKFLPQLQAELMLDYMTTAFGNASSTDHTYGDDAKKAVDQASLHVAKLVGASPKEIIFTSGATESINLVIQALC
jgi:cysteine desulfurase